MRKMLPVIIGLFSLTATAAPTVNLVMDQGAYNVGDTVTVSVVLTEFPKTHGGGFNLSYNPNVVQVQNVSIDSQTWSFITKTGHINNAEGQVSDIFFSSLNGEQGEMLPVAEITMKVMGPGDVNINATESTLNPFTDTVGQIDVDFNNTMSALVIADDQGADTAATDSEAVATAFAVDDEIQANATAINEAVLNETSNVQYTDTATVQQTETDLVQATDTSNAQALDTSNVTVTATDTTAAVADSFSEAGNTPNAVTGTAAANLWVTPVAGSSDTEAATTQTIKLPSGHGSIPVSVYEDIGKGGSVTGPDRAEHTQQTPTRARSAEYVDRAMPVHDTTRERTGVAASHESPNKTSAASVALASTGGGAGAGFNQRTQPVPVADHAAIDSVSGPIRNAILFIAAICLLMFGLLIKAKIRGR